jgi:uncharacterized FlaG/YvyC family protein
MSRAPQANPEPARERGKKMSASGNSTADVRLHFRVDPDSQDVTIVLIDRVSQRVVRTIPSDQLRELAEGELLELFT